MDSDSSVVMISSPHNSRYGPYGQSSQENQMDTPMVFTWKHGGNSVYLAGTFNNWVEKIPMHLSHGDFTCIQTLPPGIYIYRYIIDGKWQIDPEQPTKTENGELSNVIEVKEKKIEDTIFFKKFPESPVGSYTQLISEQNMNRSPPSLPPHLLHALLNTAPPEKDPTLLPSPHHVILNHLYSLPRRQDKMMILGVTQRYKSKFVTTVFYKSQPDG